MQKPSENSGGFLHMDMICQDCELENAVDRNYIIGNPTNTAQSHMACDMRIAPNFSGKKR